MEEKKSKIFKKYFLRRLGHRCGRGRHRRHRHRRRRHRRQRCGRDPLIGCQMFF